MVTLEEWRTYGLAVDAASGLVYVALGLFVASLRPRRRLSLALASFAGAFGVGIFFDNLSPDGLGLLGDGAEAVWVLCGPPVLVALALVAAWFPRPLRGRERRALVAAGALVGVVAATRLAAVAAVAPALAAQGTLHLLPSIVVYSSGLWLVLVALALRHRAAKDAPDPARERRDILLVTLALLPYMALRAGINTTWALGLAGPDVARGPLAVYALADVAMCVALSAMWLANTHGASGREARAARNVALVAVATPLAGFLFALATAPRLAADLGPLGLSRIAAVLVLAYAILRHQLFDLDIKVRWTLRQSTVAATFVGVFFVVSETAAVAFQGWTGSTYLGIAAAGALVFAIAPLQRMAERVAQAAMPGVQPGDAAYVRDRKLATYRAALQTAWADGVLRASEAELLRELADALGLDPADCDAMAREVVARAR